VADIDDIDRTLLRLLQENGRTSYAELGKVVGLSVSSVNERVRKLHERGVIEGVYSAISPSALRLDLLAFIFVGWPIRRPRRRSSAVSPRKRRSSNAIT
jgi:Lrp/AsnC family transcriptional regulator, leucine-responsive regulatory protein